MFFHFLFLYAVLQQAAAAAADAFPEKNEARGVLLLDSMTFPLLTSLLVPQSKMMIGLFDKRQVSRDPNLLEASIRRTYLNFVLDAHRTPEVDVTDLIFAQIIVNGAENAQLKQRLAGDVQLPVFVLLNGNTSSPLVIDLDLRDYRLSTFMSILNNYLGFQNSLPGIYEPFKRFAREFIPANTEVRQKLLDEAKALYEDVDIKWKISDADYYIKTMKNIMAHGPHFLREEGGRLIGRSRHPEVSEDIKHGIDRKINILESFLQSISPDEIIREVAQVYVDSAANEAGQEL